MHDKAAFIAAIKAAPDDDAPRLVYADWLEEHGESERAEFIRVMIEMERTGIKEVASVKKSYGDKSFAEAIVRLPKHQRIFVNCVNRLFQFDHNFVASWLPQIYANWKNPLSANFERGFVESLEVSAADCLAHLDTIITEHPISGVTLTTWPQLAVWYEDHERQGNPETDQKAMIRQLNRRWPGITFNLPQVREFVSMNIPIDWTQEMVEDSSAVPDLFSAMDRR